MGKEEQAEGVQQQNKDAARKQGERWHLKKVAKLVVRKPRGGESNTERKNKYVKVLRRIKTAGARIKEEESTEKGSGGT